MDFKLHWKFNQQTWLVGGFNPSEKYELVGWDDDSQYIEK
jgi:hypothetical protein